jgi:glycosyltransferase involved in cell wall biosynthesis
MLRVMQIVLSLDPGGTERLVIEIAKGLRPTVEPFICCLDQAGAWAPELAADGIPVTALGRRPGFHPRLGQQIARLASAHRAGLLHCHHYSPFVYGQMAALVHPGLRVVFTEHGRLSDAPPSLKRRLVNPVLGRLPAAIFAVSEDLRRHMIAEGLPADRVRVVHNGISLGARPTSADRDAARRSLGVDADSILIGTVGRLDPVKDLSTLLEALRILRSGRRNVRLVIVGDGPERARLEQQATRMGVGELVAFMGYRSDPRCLLPGFDMYVNSSTHEGISLTLLEAMAAALPIVATEVGGTPEVVVQDHTGLLVPARSPDRLAMAIEDLIRSPERRRAMSDRARARVEQQFSLQAMTKRYLDAYIRAAAA